MENQFTEISSSEAAAINGGGILPSLVAGLVIAAFVEIIGDWDNFKNGLAGRREAR